MFGQPKGIAVLHCREPVPVALLLTVGQGAFMHVCSQALLNSPCHMTSHVVAHV